MSHRAPAATPILTFDASEITDGAIARVPVDLATLMATRLLITGDSRSGKSRMARQLLEQTYGHVPHLVIDPEGDFATLRERFDYLLVGRGGELAADVATAAQLARSLFSMRANAIMDLSDLKPMVQREYVAAFLGELMEMHQSDGHPTIVVLDEAQFFAPEGGRAVSHDACWNLSKRGGKRGLCLVAIPQRLAECSKEVVGGLQNRLIFTTSLDGDVDRASKQLGLRTREQKDELLRLPRGECFAYGPAIGDHKVVRVRGVPETLTTHPDIARGARPAPPPARESLNALVAQLTAFAAKDKVERTTTADLQTRIRELEAKLVDAVPNGISIEQAQEDQAAAVSAAVTDERRRQDRLRQVLHQAVQTAYETMKRAVAELEVVDAGLEERWLSAAMVGAPPLALAVSQAIGRVRDAITVGSDTGTKGSPPRPAPPPPARPLPDRASTAEALHESVMREARTAAAVAAFTAPLPDGLKLGEWKIVVAIAEANSIGVSAPAREVVAVLADVSPTSSTTDKKFSVLQQKGLIVLPKSGYVALSVKGQAIAPKPEKPKTLAEFHQAWYRLLSESQRELLGAIINLYPNPIARDGLAALCNRSARSSTFDSQLSQMVRLGAIEKASPGMVTASALLFPEGLK